MFYRDDRHEWEYSNSLFCHWGVFLALFITWHGRPCLSCQVWLAQPPLHSATLLLIRTETLSRRRVIHYSVQSQEVSYLGAAERFRRRLLLLARLLNGTFLPCFAVRRRAVPRMTDILRSLKMIVWNAMTRFPEQPESIVKALDQKGGWKRGECSSLDTPRYRIMSKNAHPVW